ncbi:MAG: NUDIX domain-containing protein [Actinobacteria bacterium]|nr:NUDIX domain-containing protein [Actinomycetota bacterium]
MSEATDVPTNESEEEPYLESAGGVVYRRRRGGAVEVALVQTQRGAWVLPKGAVERGEQPQQAAIREVHEETGIVGDVEHDLGEIRYEVRPDLWTGFVPKVVHQFLLRATGGNIRPDPAEHIEARWVDLSDSVRMLHHANERTVMLRAEGYLNKQSGGGSAS